MQCSCVIYLSRGKRLAISERVTQFRALHCEVRKQLTSITDRENKQTNKQKKGGGARPKDHSWEYARGEVTKATEIEGQVGKWVFVAVDKLAEWSRTPMKTRTSYIYRFCCIYRFFLFFFFFFSPQWRAADAEIKVSSGENTELKGSPFKAWSSSAYSHTCYAYCQEFLPCSFLPFRSIHLHFFQNLSAFFPVLAAANTGFCAGPQYKISHPAGCKFPCWVPAAYK